MHYVFTSNLDNEITNSALAFYIRNINTVEELYCNIISDGKIDFYEGQSCLRAVKLALPTKSNINIYFAMKEVRNSFFIERNPGEGDSFGEALYDASGHLIDRSNDDSVGYYISPVGPLYNDVLGKPFLPTDHKFSLFTEDAEDNQELIFHGSWSEFCLSNRIE